MTREEKTAEDSRDKARHDRGMNEMSVGYDEDKTVTTQRQNRKDTGQGRD